MSELHNMVGHLVRRLNQISVAVFNDHMSRIGVDLTPVQYAALLTIDETPGMDQASLAGAIAYDKATLGGVVDRLAGKGLIERRKSEIDRRARVLMITSKGRELLTLVRPLVRSLQDDILTGLDEAEKSQLLSLLVKTTAAGNTRSRAPLKPPA